jgi:hypothetical protein
LAGLFEYIGFCSVVKLVAIPYKQKSLLYPQLPSSVSLSRIPFDLKRHCCDLSLGGIVRHQGIDAALYRSRWLETRTGAHEFDHLGSPASDLSTVLIEKI